MRKLQLLLGLLLAAGAFVAVILVGKLTQPPTYEVVVVLDETAAFTPLSEVKTGVDTQSLSPSVAQKYVLREEMDALLAAESVVVETLHPGQPLLREQVASGAEAEGLSRLAVALKDPNQVIVSVPVHQEQLPAIVPGDVVALFFTAGQIQARSLVTETVKGPTPTPTPRLPFTPTLAEKPVTVTTELQLPVAKWLANGIVYRLNREKRQNPNYGAPGMENEPRYIEGPIQSLDIVIPRATAEWVAFALAHGHVQIAVLPAVTKPDIEAGTFPPEPGVTWSDFEDAFFRERAEVEEKEK